jgi:hypothetical protein
MSQQTPLDLSAGAALAPTPQGGAAKTELSERMPRRQRARSLQKLRERLPHYTPSPKQLEIFELVVCQNTHQLEVAAMFNITQQRVSTIVRKVRDWVAAWGGDEYRYGPAQQARISSFTAIKTLEQFMRDVRFEIGREGSEYHCTRIRHDAQGEKVIDRVCRQYPKQASLYRLLFQSIMAVARFGGAGQDRELVELAGDGATPQCQGQSQSMVFNAAINVHAAGAASNPPAGELYEDNRSEPTYVERPVDVAATSEDNKANCYERCKST